MTTGTPFPCVPPRNDHCYGVDDVSGVSDAFTTTSPGKFRVVKNYQHLLAAAYSDFLSVGDVLDNKLVFTYDVTHSAAYAML